MQYLIVFHKSSTVLKIGCCITVHGNIHFYLFILMHVACQIAGES